MARRFNPAPGWPRPPSGWTPPPGWKPDPSWPPAPEGWQFWIDDATGAASEQGATGQEAPPAGPPAAPGWEPPDAAGPGFGAWVRDHKIISAAVAFLAVILGSWWLFGDTGRESDRTIGGVSQRDRPQWPDSEDRNEPLPTNAFRTKTAALTAAINAALDSPLPGTSAPPTPTGPGASGPPTTTGGSSHGVSVEALGRDGTPIRITWSIDESLTGVAAKDAARTDAVKILGAVKSTADYGYSRLVLTGMYPVGGPSGPQQRAVEARYSKATVDRLNLATIDPRKIFEAGDGPAFLDPSMQY